MESWSIGRIIKALFKIQIFDEKLKQLPDPKYYLVNSQQALMDPGKP